MGQGLTVAIDIGGTKMLLRAEDDGGTVVRDERSVTGSDVTPEWLDDEIDRFIHAVGPVANLAIACPGLIAADESRVVVSDVLPSIAGWRPRALGRQPGSRLVNDVRAALWGATSGDGDIEDLAVVVVGTGIATAFTSHGRVHAGVAGWAGELGSMPVDANGSPGTLDSIASGAAILARAGGSAEHIHQLLSRGDSNTRDVVQDAGRALGQGIATLLNLLNPGRLVLAGGTLAYPGYVAAALASAERWTLPELWGSCTVSVDDDPGTLVLRGVTSVARSTP